MRVIAGSRRSLPLKTIEGDATRPTTDKYKETLFNCLQMDVPDANVLDLFAGSGAIGIEALSRGAHHATFVESGREQISVIKYNVNFTKFQDQSDIFRIDALSFVRNLTKVNFDLIYIDPPYGKGLEKAVLEILNDKEFANPDYKIVVEAKLDDDFSFLDDTRFIVYKQKNYKTNKHIFLCERA